jgi:hypothetical protein
MNWLKRLFGAGQTAGSSDTHALIYFVKGAKCGAVTRVRIDKRNDLSRDDDGGYFVRKFIVDSVCYGSVEIELRFDAQLRETERQITGGVFVDEAAWRAAQAANLKEP